MENLVQPFIKAFGWSILNSLWQSAIIYGVLFIILLSLPKLAAKYKHNLAFGSIVLMFLCFAYNFIFRILTGTPKAAEGLNLHVAQPYTYFNTIPPSFSSKAEQYFPMVVAFYLIGIVLQLYVITKGYKKLARFKNESLSAVPEEWKTLFNNVIGHLKINKKIRFHLSEIVNVPLVIGYLKPVVLFPLALVNQLDTDQVEAILIHELSHIRRNDFLLNLIKTAIETFLFFNPFVWMAGKFIHIEREHACDDLVLKFTGKPLNYAHALLKLELLKDKNSPAYALAATGKTQNLYQRIKRITNMKTNYLNAKQQMAALTLGIACLFSIAWISPADKKKETKKTVKLFAMNTNSLMDHSTRRICTDTTKKRKIKIVTVDAQGKRTEYNSVKEMPDSLKNDFLKNNISFNGNFNFNLDSNNFVFNFDTTGYKAIHKKMNSPEWKAKMAAIQKNAVEISRKYNSSEWKANALKIQVDAEKLAAKFNSPEWKANIEKIQKNALEISTKHNSPEWEANIAKIQKNSLEIASRHNSPEWKANIEKIQKNALEMATKYNSAEWRANMERIQKNALEISKKYNSPEWKQKVKEMQELQDSDEYQELRKKFDKDVQELKEKKKERKEKPEQKEAQQN